MKRFSLFLANALCLMSLYALDIDLSGTWELYPIAAGAWAHDPDAEAVWIPARIPAAGWDTDAEASHQDGDGVWLRRSFELSPAESAGGAALVWECIRWDFRAWVNGVEIQGRPGGAPGSADLPPGTLRAGQNELRLQVRNWGSLPRGAGGEPLFPIGSARFNWGNRNAFVFGQIGLDLYRRARIRAALLDGDPQTGQVELRLLGDLPPGARLAWRILEADGTLLAEGEAPAAARQSFSVPDLPAWTPESPRLLRAELRLLDGDGEELDRRTESFGARRLHVEGRLHINGIPRTLLGSNLVHEWLSMETEEFHRMIVDEARAMHVTGFRTHTLPPSRELGAFCDREGVWLLAEMPLTFNGVSVRQTEEEERIWRANAMDMVLAWCEWLYNHPAILGWVPVNESPPDNGAGLIPWIHDELLPRVAEHFPGRPVINAWGRSPDVDDLHVYAGFWGGHEGAFRAVSERHAADRDPRRILANTEYIEDLNPERNFRWSGPAADPLHAEFRYAAIAANQTEDLRRLDYGLVLPYWFANWRGPRHSWRPDAPRPIFAALRSALAPDTVVMDLTHRNFAAGSLLRGTAVLVNDTPDAITRELNVYLESQSPGWSAAELRGEPLFTQSVTLPPFARAAVPVALRLPAEEGVFFVVARAGDRLSQREVRTFAPLLPPARRVRLFGAPAGIADGLRRLGLHVEEGMSPSLLDLGDDVVVVWENARIEAATGMAAMQLSTWLRNGGHLVFLSQPLWTETNRWTAFAAADTLGFLTWSSERDEASTVWMEGEGSGWRREWGDGWNGYEGLLIQHAPVAPWLPGSSPVLQNAAGWLPALPGSRPLPLDTLEQAWPRDAEDSRFFAEGRLRTFTHLRSPAPTLLLTRQPGEHPASLRFNSPAFEGRLLVFEHGRSASSPFRWRINGGDWTAVTRANRSAALQRVSGETNVWFGWTDLGAVALDAGEQLLEIAVDGPTREGVTHLAFDQFLLLPGVSVNIRARSGGGRPALLDLPAGRGRITLSTPLFGTRLDPESEVFDPAAVRWFYQLIAPPPPPVPAEPLQP